jgi:hypothetical protein
MIQEDAVPTIASCIRLYTELDSFNKAFMKKLFPDAMFSQVLHLLNKNAFIYITIFWLYLQNIH